MQAGNHYWWNKEPRTKHNVEVISTQFTTHPNTLINPDPTTNKSILVRLLAGVHIGCRTVAASVRNHAGTRHSQFDSAQRSDS